MSQILVDAADINIAFKKIFGHAISFVDGHIILDFGELTGHLSETEIRSKLNLKYNGLSLNSNRAELDGTGLKIDFTLD